MNQFLTQSVRFIIMLGVTLSVCLLAGCGASDQSDKKLVVCTTGIVADLVRNVVSGNMEVVALMGPGVDPHLYKVTEGDIRRLSEADIIFYNGLHLESKMTEILEKLDKRKSVYKVTAAIPKDQLIYDDTYESFPDPHVWFDVQLWMNAAQYVSAIMASVDAEHKTVYKKSGVRYIRELQALEREVTGKLAMVPKDQRVLVTAHDAFGYFAKAYGFQVRALQGVSTESEAGVKDIRELSQFIASRKIPAVFIESSVPKRYMQALIEATEAKQWDIAMGGELFSDALGTNGTLEGTYIGMVRHNVDTIVNALK